MKKCPTKEFLQESNKLFEAISAIGLGRSQRKVVDLIVRYTHGVTVKIKGERFYNSETDELRQADIARILGFSATHTREVLEALIDKNVIFWNERCHQFRINEELPKRFGYKEPEHTEMLGKNIRKLKAETDLLWKPNLTETATRVNTFSASESQKNTPKYNNNIVKTTNKGGEIEAVKRELLRFLGSVDSVRNPEAYLAKIINEYGEASLKKLRKLEIGQWYEHLEYWKNK